MKVTDQELVQRLKAGDEDTLKAIYLQYRQPFISWLVSQNCPPDRAADLYQLTVLILYDNVAKGKLKVLRSSLRTYLFSIGKNKWKEQQRENAKTSQIFDEFFYDHIDPSEFENRKEYEALLDHLSVFLENLGNPCKCLLELFYYNKLSMKEISKKMGYKNVATAKNQKYKCLKRLQKIFQQELEKKSIK